MILVLQNLWKNPEILNGPDVGNHVTCIFVCFKGFMTIFQGTPLIYNSYEPKQYFIYLKKKHTLRIRK